MEKVIGREVNRDVSFMDERKLQKNKKQAFSDRKRFNKKMTLPKQSQTNIPKGDVRVCLPKKKMFFKRKYDSGSGVAFAAMHVSDPEFSRCYGVAAIAR